MSQITTDQIQTGNEDDQLTNQAAEAWQQLLNESRQRLNALGRATADADRRLQLAAHLLKATRGPQTRQRQIDLNQHIFKQIDAFQDRLATLQTELGHEPQVEESEPAPETSTTCHLNQSTSAA